MHTKILGETPNSLEEHFSILIVWFFIALISSWVAWNRGFFHLPQRQVKDAGLSIWEVLGAFAVFLSVMMFITPLLTLGWLSIKAGHIVNARQVALDPITEGWVSVCSIALTAIGLWIFCRTISTNSLKAIWGPSSFQGMRHNIKNAFFGASAWLICYPWVIILSQLIATVIFALNLQLPHYEQVAVKYLRMTMSHPLLFSTMSLFLVFVVPVIEETLFRGFLQTWLKQYLGTGWAIFMASLVFASFHFSTTQGYDNIELLSSLFLLACFLGYVYERQQSLWASIGLHATFNAVSVLVISLV